MEDDTKTVVAEAELPPNLKNLWLKALSAVELRNFEYATNLLQTVLKEEPKFLDGRKCLRRAEIEQKKGAKKSLFGGSGLGGLKLGGSVKKDPLGAIVEIEKGLLKDPHNQGLNQSLYEAGMRAGMPELAAFALETIRDGAPSNTRNLHQLAEHHLQHKNPAEARKVYSAIVSVDATDMEAVKGEKDAAAQESMQKQNWDAGFRENLADEDAAADLESQGRAAMTKDQLEERLGRLSAEYEADGTNVEVVKKIADTYEKLEDLGSAIQWYEYAHSLSANDTSLERRVEMLKEKHGEQELKDLKKEIDENPDAPDVEEKKAKLEAMETERVTGLVEDAKRRVERNPTDKQLRFELGQHLFRAGEFTDAIPQLQQARSNPHMRNRAMLLLGQCFARKNMLDMAAAQFSEAAGELPAMDDTKKELLYELAMVCEKSGDKAKYIEALKEIYEADYGYRDVAKRVEESYGD